MRKLERNEFEKVIGGKERFFTLFQD